MDKGPLSGVLRHLRCAALLYEVAGLTDSDLLGRYLTERDEAAFEVLLQRHAAMVLGVCRRILRNEADAHDAFQATFLIFVRKAASIHPRELVGNWLYGVAHKTSLKAKAMNRQRRAKERQRAAAPRTSAREEVWQELQALLDEAVRRLPDKYRTPVVLCELEGKSLKEAAHHLGCPPGTVASRLARARGMLARRLARHLPSRSVGSLVLVLAAQAASPAVSPSLLRSTLQAATAVAAGQATTPGLISPHVVALTEGVVKTMRLTKLTRIATVLLALALLAGGGLLLTYAAVWAEPSLVEPGSPTQALAPRDKPPKDKKPKSDKDALHGTWLLVSEERNGKKLPAEKIKGSKMVFADGKFTWQGEVGTQEREGTFTIDPEKNPKEIDLTFRTITLQGIYELKGNRLKLVIAERGRPSEFDSTGTGLLVLQKKK
jgi:RNA polymerase sigma factor (sigma-70 family)